MYRHAERRQLVSIYFTMLISFFIKGAGGDVHLAGGPNVKRVRS
jgi:hypothetical protein